VTPRADQHAAPYVRRPSSLGPRNHLREHVSDNPASCLGQQGHHIRRTDLPGEDGQQISPVRRFASVGRRYAMELLGHQAERGDLFSVASIDPTDHVGLVSVQQSIASHSTSPITVVRPLSGRDYRSLGSGTYNAGLALSPTLRR